MSEINQQADGQHKKYESALQLAFYEGQISWQMNVLFVGLNIGIGTILQNKLESFQHQDWPTMIMSAMGLIINTIWLATFFRNNRYYEFRMAQARNAEPSGFSLVNGDGYDFSQGEEVKFAPAFGSGPSKHKLNWFEQAGRNKYAILFSIICFLLGFLILLVVSIIPASEVA